LSTPPTAAVAISALSAPSRAAGCPRRRRSTTARRSSERVDATAPSRRLEAPREYRPRREGEREQHELGRDVAERRTVERPRHDPPEQRRLHENDEGGRQPGRDVEGQHSPRGPRQAEQARVERAH
jgi:hypothetical protein